VAAATPPALLHAPEGALPARTLLLVLEEGPEGVAVLDARVADVTAKTRAKTATSETDGLILALTDEAGEVLVVVETDVPRTLFGPFEGDDGRMHCAGRDVERPVFAVKVPWPADATRLVIVALAPAPDGATETASDRATETASGTALAASDLVRALRSNPADAGLVVRGGGRLADLLAAAGSTP
jgi:hypothetical protein